jgi:hypothetical protein
MNIVFLCKWYWNYRYVNASCLWQSIISFKYTTTSTQFSTFWKAVTTVSHFLLLGAKRIIGNGQTINFWMDNWYADYLLSLMFPHVYAKTKSSSMSLNEVWNEGQVWNLIPLKHKLFLWMTLHNKILTRDNL